MSDNPDQADEVSAAEALDRYLAGLHAGDVEHCHRWLAEHPHLRALAGCLDALGQFPAPSGTVSPAQLADEAYEPDLEKTIIPGNGTLESGIGTDDTGAGEFGKYDLVEEIGRGGMGVVFKARQRDLNRVVALKMILSNQLAGDDDVKRFYREARAAGSLRHPHIVGIHEVGQFNGQHYFAMDFISGTSLAGLTRSGPIDPEEAARCLVRVARAVQYLHEHGIVHRDLKPSNILLDEARNPYVTDFGLAKVFDEQDEKTQTGTTLGTPGYMPPEQAAGKVSEISCRSDVYSLGAILYEMLTGRPPFREDTPHRTILQVIHSEPTLPNRLNPRVRPELERICLKCLEKNPDRRYASAAALANDLDRYLRREPLEARAAGFTDHFRRWIRRESGLAARLAIMLAAMFLMEGEHLLSHRAWTYHLEIKIAFVAWAFLAIVFQWFLRRPKSADFARLAWAITDPLLLLFVLSHAEDVGPILIGYPVIVTAAGLWFSVRLVATSTIACVLSYVALLALRQEPTSPAHYPLIFVMALIVIGAVVGFQVYRVQTLSRYFDQARPNEPDNPGGLRQAGDEAGPGK